MTISVGLCVLLCVGAEAGASKRSIRLAARHAGIYATPQFFIPS